MAGLIPVYIPWKQLWRQKPRVEWIKSLYMASQDSEEGSKLDGMQWVISASTSDKRDSCAGSPALYQTMCFQSYTFTMIPSSSPNIIGSAGNFQWFCHGGLPATSSLLAPTCRNSSLPWIRGIPNGVILESPRPNLINVISDEEEWGGGYVLGLQSPLIHKGTGGGETSGTETRMMMAEDSEWVRLNTG